jgi:ABC-2 type transport system ATP-binding protein
VVSPQGSPRVLVGDTFGEQKEIILELRHPPTGEQSAILGRAGFVAHHGGLTWMMNGTESEHSAASLSEGLHRAGIATREVRFREPGLDSLFVHLSRGAVPNGAAAP